MAQPNTHLSRRKFLAWGTALISFFSLPVFLRRKKITTPGKNLVLLTRDGVLVEVDVAHLPDKRQKAKNKDIQNWMQKNPISF